MERKAVGCKLKESLRIAGRSPNWLAERTGIGVRTVYSVLNGHHTPSVDKLLKICEALSLSLDELFEIDVNSFPLFPEPYQESLTYAQFESRHFGPHGGERISVSRGFSVVNQAEELREYILRKVYNQTDSQTEVTMQGFRERLRVIREQERFRLEIVVQSEIMDFIHQRGPYDAVPGYLIHECIEGIIHRLEHDPLSFELVFIPRQFFLVNYEIINREVILFDLGTVFMKQTHPRIIKHFLHEVQRMKTQHAVLYDRQEVAEFMRQQLQLAKVKRA